MTYHTSDRHLSSHFSRSRLIVGMCALLLVCLLTACSLGGGSTGTVPTTTSSNTPATPHATSVPAHPTSAPAASLTTYTGNGFRIGYPAGWSIEKASPSAASVIFIDPTRTVSFIVTVAPNPNANSATSVALDPLLQSMQSKPHYQKVDLAPTTTVGGETWDQIGAIGDLSYSGKPLSIQINALAINRSAGLIGQISPGMTILSIGLLNAEETRCQDGREGAWPWGGGVISRWGSKIASQTHW